MTSAGFGINDGYRPDRIKDCNVGVGVRVSVTSTVPTVARLLMVVVVVVVMAMMAVVGSARRGHSILVGAVTAVLPFLVPRQGVRGLER